MLFLLQITLSTVTDVTIYSQLAQLSLTNLLEALHHDKWQNFKTVT